MRRHAQDQQGAKEMEHDGCDRVFEEGRLQIARNVIIRTRCKTQGCISGSKYSPVPFSALS